ncbi:MAG: hypothetical protein QOI89_2479 [Solirubrobacteraceae bacterium]|nr:hypothetical protein [Solirubrobacteraceae bacterium]
MSAGTHLPGRRSSLEGIPSNGEAATAKPAPPALALNVEGACAALGVSWDLFHAEIEPELRIVRIGRRKLVAVTELQRWLDDHAERVLEP